MIGYSVDQKNEGKMIYKRFRNVNKSFYPHSFGLQNNQSYYYYESENRQLLYNRKFSYTPYFRTISYTSHFLRKLIPCENLYQLSYAPLLHVRCTQSFVQK